MERKETDIKSIREIACEWLYRDIQESDFPFIAHHPYTNSWIVVLDNQILDLHDKDTGIAWREKIKGYIEKSSLEEIVMFIRRPYILDFLSETEDFLSSEDMSMALRECWQSIEIVNFDESSSEQQISLFLLADQKTLMNKEMKEFFDELPSEVTVYRGVTSQNQKYKKAVSWTTDRSVAEWFARRFESNGEVWSTTVPKEDIICAFGGKEKEIIVNLFAHDPDIKSQKVS